MNQADAVCSDTARNQACYGNSSIQAHLRNADAAFENPGQIVDIGALESMQLGKLDASTGEWGIAVLRLQAGLPDTIPGQNVTMLLFGNTEFRTVDNADGIQAFYFQSSFNLQSTCTSAPPDGLIVQTPEGVTEVQFKLNNIEIQLGSTAFLQAEPGVNMTVNVIEGQAVVTANNVSETVPHPPVQGFAQA
jgi:hypothetical protein